MVAIAPMDTHLRLFSPRRCASQLTAQASWLANDVFQALACHDTASGGMLRRGRGVSAMWYASLALLHTSFVGC